MTMGEVVTRKAQVPIQTLFRRTFCFQFAFSKDVVSIQRHVEQKFLVPNPLRCISESLKARIHPRTVAYHTTPHGLHRPLTKIAVVSLSVSNAEGCSLIQLSLISTAK